MTGKMMASPLVLSSIIQHAKKVHPEEFKAWSQNMGHEGVLTTK